MTLQGIPFRRQESLSIVYKGEIVESSYVPDFIVDNKVIVEVKAVARLVDIHKQQLMTYLKLTRCEVGLLINFNTMVLTHGVKRVIYHCP